MIIFAINAIFKNSKKSFFRIFKNRVNCENYFNCVKIREKGFAKINDAKFNTLLWNLLTNVNVILSMFCLFKFRLSRSLRLNQCHLLATVPIDSHLGNCNWQQQPEMLIISLLSAVASVSITLTGVSWHQWWPSNHIHNFGVSHSSC